MVTARTDAFLQPKSELVVGLVAPLGAELDAAAHPAGTGYATSAMTPHLNDAVEGKR